MPFIRPFLAAIAFAIGLIGNVAFAETENINQLPKYGLVAKNAIQKNADQKLITEIDQMYKGDRKKAASDAADRGWQFFHQGNDKVAMQRFNQAWLLDSKNGQALWGMAAVSSIRRDTTRSLALFLEAQQYLGEDIDFAVDHAKAIGFAGALRKDKALLNDAFSRFARNYERAPQHTLNLQNWAITLFYTGNYAEAWRKVKLAEATPRRAELDQTFIADLQKKMPRP